MKQTAVEWLEQQLYKAGWEQLTHEEKMNICCTAKMMEKDEISDEVLFEQATVAMEEHYGYGCETEIDAYFRGAKWMQKNMYTEEQVREAMEFARGHHKMTDTQFIETLK
jgi:hypothetical protein